MNVVDLMKLQPHSDHPHGLTDEDYDLIFTKDKPIIFAFHGYPKLIHELTYTRRNQNMFVCGYVEEGTIDVYKRQSLPSSSSMLMHLPMVASHTMLTPMATSLSISFCTMAFGRRNSGMP